MYVLELMVLITVFFSVAGLIAALAAAVVVADKFGSAWYHSEPKEGVIGVQVSVAG